MVRHAFLAGLVCVVAASSGPLAAEGERRVDLRSDLTLPEQELAMLTVLQYYHGPEPGEEASAAISRALTNWLFHHRLPAATPVTAQIIEKMKADWVAGDVLPTVRSPIGANSIDELPRSPNEPAAPPVPVHDVEAYCRNVFPNENEYYNICIRKNQEAYNRLRQAWAYVPSGTRDYCSEVFTDEYEMFLLCVNKELQAGANRPSFQP